MRTLVFLFFMVVTHSVFGAGRASVEFMAHTLELDDAQRVRVELIMKDQHAAHKELRRNRNGTRPSCEDMKALRMQTRVRLYDVLNEQQLSKYDEMNSKRARRCESRASNEVVAQR